MNNLTKDKNQDQIKARDEEKLQEALQALKEARELEQTLLTHGLDGIDLYVANIEGDWLENWGQSDSFTD